MALATSSASAIVSSRLFGDFNRYKLQVQKTRFNTIEFFVVDAECIDENGLRAIVGQSDDIRKAVANLDAEDQDDLLRAPTKKGQIALNLSQQVCKVVEFDSLRGVLVECLFTNQKWYADKKQLILIG